MKFQRDQILGAARSRALRSHSAIRFRIRREEKKTERAEFGGSFSDERASEIVSAA